MGTLSLPFLRCGNFSHDTMGGDAGYGQGEKQKGFGNSNHTENRILVPISREKRKGM